MSKQPRRGADGPMDWVRERLGDPADRDAIQALMTEIDVRQDLIALREAAGLTQVQLAEKLGVTQSVISKLESRDGTKDVRLSTLVKVAAALGARVRITFDKTAAKTKRARKTAAA